MTAGVRIEALTTVHDRKSFSCGVPALDRYLKEQAGQDIKRRVAQCYVACADDGRIAGFYTLSAGDVALGDVPEDIGRKLPRYPAVPVARVGRLAVGRNFQGQRLGSALLWDAATRALHADIGIFALAVDAKDERAVAFYKHHGFVAFASNPNKLLLPLATIAQV